MNPNGYFRRFVFNRKSDPSNFSGAGIVLEGVQFSDGKVSARWVVGNHRSSVYYDSVDDAITIHGHDGATELVWIDGQR